MAIICFLGVLIATVGAFVLVCSGAEKPVEVFGYQIGSELIQYAVLIRAAGIAGIVFGAGVFLIGLFKARK